MDRTQWRTICEQDLEQARRDFSKAQYAIAAAEGALALLDAMDAEEAKETAPLPKPTE